MKVVEFLEARGHQNVIAINEKTFEFTKEDWLTKKGDCIIAVASSKGISEISDEFKRLARREDAEITITINVGGFSESASGYGSSSLSFKHPTDFVARKSTYTCERTIMIKSDKAASDFSRYLIQALKQPTQIVKIELSVYV